MPVVYDIQFKIDGSEKSATCYRVSNEKNTDRYFVVKLSDYTVETFYDQTPDNAFAWAESMVK